MTSPSRSSKPAKRQAAKKPPTRPVPTFDHLRAKQPVRVPYWVAMDDGTASQLLSEAKRQLGRALIRNDETEVEKARQAVADAEENMRNSSVRILFQGLGRYQFEKLMAEHPPTEEQKAELSKVGREAEYNWETFAAPLVAACAIEPKMTVEQVEELQHGVTTDEDGNELDIEDERYVAPWNQAEFSAMFQAALQSCTTRRDADLGF